MKYLEYPLFAEGYVNRFLTAGVFTEVQQFDKVKLHGRVNEWLKKGFAIHENPCRKEFVRKRQENIPDYLELDGAADGKMWRSSDRGARSFRTFRSATRAWMALDSITARPGCACTVMCFWRRKGIAMWSLSWKPAAVLQSGWMGRLSRILPHLQGTW